MRTKKHFLMFLLGGLLILSSSAHAAPVCISNMDDFKKNKASFPGAFQNLPVMFTAENFLVTAGLKIREANGKIKLEGSVWKPSEIYSDDSYVSKLCFDGGSGFKVTLENGKSYNVKVSGGSATISGVSFKKSSSATFAGIIEKIKEAKGGSTKTAGKKGTK